jgi:metal-responsive CopG/Arc/MetJ family transcriptional regulator
MKDIKQSRSVEMVRKRVSVTLPQICIDFLDNKVAERVCASRSHAMEVLILEAIKAKKRNLKTET